MNEPILTTDNIVETDAKDLATVPEKPKTLTRKEIGKLRRQYITITLGTVKACGHKFDPKNQPKRNCEYCWQAYFYTAVDTAAVHDDLTKGGKRQLIKVYGEKFSRAFGRFLTAALVQESHGNQKSAESVGDSGDQHTHSDQCNGGVCTKVPGRETSISAS